MKKRGIFEYIIYASIGIFIISIGVVTYLIFFSSFSENNFFNSFFSTSASNLGGNFLFEDIGFLGIAMITLIIIFVSLIIFILIVYFRIKKLKQINRFNKIRKYSEINPVMDELLNKAHEALTLNKLKESRDIYLKIKQIYDPSKDKIIADRIINLYKGILNVSNPVNKNNTAIKNTNNQV